jgi:hypothetical protein
VIELFDKFDRYAIGTAEPDFDRACIAENGSVSESVKLVDRSCRISNDLFGANTGPAVGEGSFKLAENVIGKGCRVGEVVVFVLSQVAA